MLKFWARVYIKVIIYEAVLKDLFGATRAPAFLDVLQQQQPGGN